MGWLPGQVSVSVGAAEDEGGGSLGTPVLSCFLRKSGPSLKGLAQSPGFGVSLSWPVSIHRGSRWRGRPSGSCWHFCFCSEQWVHVSLYPAALRQGSDRGGHQVVVPAPLMNAAMRQVDRPGLPCSSGEPHQVTAEEEMEKQRGQITFLWQHFWEMAEPTHEPRIQGCGCDPTWCVRLMSQCEIPVGGQGAGDEVAGQEGSADADASDRQPKSSFSSCSAQSPSECALVRV